MPLFCGTDSSANHGVGRIENAGAIYTLREPIGERTDGILFEDRTGVYVRFCRIMPFRRRPSDGRMTARLSGRGRAVAVDARDCIRPPVPSRSVRSGSFIASDALWDVGSFVPKLPPLLRTV